MQDTCFDNPYTGDASLHLGHIHENPDISMLTAFILPDSKMQHVVCIKVKLPPKHGEEHIQCWFCAVTKPRSIVMAAVATRLTASP